MGSAGRAGARRTQAGACRYFFAGAAAAFGAAGLLLFAEAAGAAALSDLLAGATFSGFGFSDLAKAASAPILTITSSAVSGYLALIFACSSAGFLEPASASSQAARYALVNAMLEGACL